MVQLISNGKTVSKTKINNNIKTFDENELKDLDPESFIIFARLILKDNILNNNDKKCWQNNLEYDAMIKLNKFFENIPEDYIQLESSVKRKILLKYIISNLNYGFGIKVTDNDINKIYKLLEDLERVDPRIKNKK